MATPHEIRRLAFQCLYQLDARGGDAEAVRASLGGVEGLSPRECDRAMETAVKAWDAKAAADEEFTALAPAWPVHRQAAVDRAILRLAHHELSSKAVEPAIAVNEAVELAKEFSTEKAPGFINALLDRVMRRLAGESVTPITDLPVPTTSQA
ncbi:MAG: transcription antitermination factor NusB [Phycisphaerales bacterium]